MAQLFSIIIPVYNRANLIGRAIESVQNQTFRSYELIIVDDGSVDRTAEVAAAAAPQALVLRQENLGPGPARNAGISRAKGLYIAFLDSDDVWFPWTLQCYSDAIVKHSNPPCLFGCVRRFVDPSELDSIAREPLETQQFDDYLGTLGSDVFQGTGVAALRTDVVRAQNGFLNDRVFCEDLDFFMRMGTAGPIVYVQSPTMVGLSCHSESSMTDLSRTWAGTAFLIEQEKRGAYPGDNGRRRERIRLLLHHIRWVLYACQARREVLLAWHLYKDTFRWMVEVREFRLAAELPTWLLKELLRRLGIRRARG
jgi:glycosyltransferase involved in cell wall biosynthesis